MSDHTQPWHRQETVRGFVESPPNQTLLRYAGAERERLERAARLLDIGCGAGRNAVPLAEIGWPVYGVDTSLPMLAAAAARVGAMRRIRFARAAMDRLPFRDATFDFLVAHGIWNLAASDAEFRQAIGEAARVARPGAALFVFTFSRHTIPDSAGPCPGEQYVYGHFSGRPQVFVTAEQLIAELAAAGFEPDSALPLTEHNRPSARMLATGGPVFYEGAFRARW